MERERERRVETLMTLGERRCVREEKGGFEKMRER